VRGGHVRGNSRLVLPKSRRCRGCRGGRISTGCVGCEEGGKGVKGLNKFLVDDERSKKIDG
jgi:hypothetical protein